MRHRRFPHCIAILENWSCRINCFTRSTVSISIVFTISNVLFRRAETDNGYISLLSHNSFIESFLLLTPPTIAYKQIIYPHPHWLMKQWQLLMLANMGSDWLVVQSKHVTYHMRQVWAGLAQDPWRVLLSIIFVIANISLTRHIPARKQYPKRKILHGFVPPLGRLTWDLHSKLRLLPLQCASKFCLRSHVL